MLVDYNGNVRELTTEEEQEWLDKLPQAVEETKDNETALKDFFTGLASGETTTIAKIRQLAKDFLEKSED